MLNCENSSEDKFISHTDSPIFWNFSVSLSCIALIMVYWTVSFLNLLPGINSVAHLIIPPEKFLEMLAPVELNTRIELFNILSALTTFGIIEYEIFWTEDIVLLNS